MQWIGIGPHTQINVDMLFYVAFAGKFDAMGVAEGIVDPQLGPIKVMRLSVHSESDNWAILSEVSRMCNHLLAVNITIHISRDPEKW